MCIRDRQWGVSPSNKVLSRIQRFRNRVVLLLQDRAAFYLPDDILSIYLPLPLAKRRSFSTSARLFQQTGMAHLLAISGLHIALIYGIIYFLLKKFFGLSLKLMEWVHLHTMVQLTALSVLLLYIFLLEWSIPALSAATMLSLLVCWKSAESGPGSVVFFVFNQFYVFNRKTGDAL